MSAIRGRPVRDEDFRRAQPRFPMAHPPCALGASASTRAFWRAAAGACRVYNLIDAPAARGQRPLLARPLRVAEIPARGALLAVMPVGPEFALPEALFNNQAGRGVQRAKDLSEKRPRPPDRRAFLSPKVNALMNRARIGVVCGGEDAAPAILTEGMLAGLPVLASAHLRCG